MTNPLDYTIQDPEAMRYALMQNSSYRGGGAVRMAQGGQVMSKAIGSQVQRFDEGGYSHQDINDLKPNHPSDVKSTSDKPQPKIPAIPVRDILATIGLDRAKYEMLALDPTAPFQDLSPHELAAGRLLDAANVSGNPERYLETLSPYQDFQLRFYAKDSDSPYPKYGGWVDPAEKDVANINLTRDGNNVVSHELAHTRQFLSGQESRLPIMLNAVHNNIQKLPEGVRSQIMYGGNANDNLMEMWANIDAYAHNYNAAGGDFINSPEGRIIFPTPELQREYYTRTIPGINSATPDTGTFTPNAKHNPKESYAQQAMRALGYAEGGQASQDQMRYELTKAK